MLPADVTEVQQYFADAVETGLVVGTVAASFIVFLLAVIAVRGLSSWS